MKADETEQNLKNKNELQLMFSKEELQTNPLLNISENEMPAFSKIKTQHFLPAMAYSIFCSQNLIVELKKIDNCNYENFVQKIEDQNNKRGKIYSILSLYYGNMISQEINSVWEKSTQILTEYISAFFQDVELFKKYQSIKDSKEYQTLTQPKKQTLKNILKDFTLNGVNLSPQAQKEVTGLKKELVSLQAQFANNISSSIEGWSYHVVDETELKGVPDDIKDILKQEAQAKGQTGWMVNLEGPIAGAILSYAENRPLREKVYRAKATMASADPVFRKWDNASNIQKILKLRKQYANKLGFKNFAEWSIEHKMVSSYDEAFSFLKDLLKKTKAKAKEGWGHLKQFAAEDGLVDFKIWDFAYYTRKYKETKYDFDSEELKQYFPLNKVLKGLFLLLKKMYGITIEEVETPNVWRKEVKQFCIFRGEKKPQKVGYFYCDLLSSSKKSPGAWMSELMRSSKGVQPVAYISCNFTPSTPEHPHSLLTHSDILTLFHEMGHCLHHMLTDIKDSAVSGIEGVEWDAVEVPSQFMEGFVWDKTVLQSLSEHIQTKESVPSDLYVKLIKTKTLFKSFFFVRQIEFSLFDLIIHSDEIDSAFQVLSDIRKDIGIFEYLEEDYFPNSFAHIFSRGYAAGYYSYLWSLVLAVDIFFAFKGNVSDHSKKMESCGAGVENNLEALESVGQKFLNSYLSRGGSEPTAQLFQSFMGRKPQLDALLMDSGFKSGS